MPRLLWCAALVCASIALPVTVAAEQAPIRVFIGAVTQGEFIDMSAEVRDSIKDLAGKLRGTKGALLVQDREQADVTITVVTRGVGSEPYGQRLAYQEHYRGAELVSVPMSVNTWWVTAVLDVRGADYRKEFVGSYTHPPTLAYYGGAWRACAGQLSKNIKAWLEANNERLRARIQGPARQ